MNEVEIKLMSKFKYVDNVHVFENSNTWYLAHHTPKGIKYYIVKDIEALASIYFPKKVKKINISDVNSSSRIYELTLIP